MLWHSEQNHWKDCKTFRNVSLLIEFTSLLKTINSQSELIVGQEESLTQYGCMNLVG